MILCYALGGGLGHLTRMRALLHSLGEAAGGEPVTVLVSSPLALDPRALGGWSGILAPAALAAASEPARAALGAWVAAAVARLRPRAIYVDAFPGGILGELCGMDWPAGATLIHAARRLRWPRYRARLAGPLPPFAVTYLLEPLEPDHRAALAGCARTLTELALADPPATAAAAPAPPPPVAREAPAAGAWLIVHSGPVPEIVELVAYAESLQRLEGSTAPLALIAPQRTAADVARYDIYPAWPLFAAAPRIVTACGFNLMRQTAPHRDRHRYLPFPRPLDDQFVRAAWRRDGRG